MADGGTGERILDAAFEVMRSEGLNRATTKNIAAAAGVSERAVYSHFPDRNELLYHALMRHLPRVHGLILSTDTEGVTLEAGLRHVALEAIAYLVEVGPVALALDANPQLQQRIAATFAANGVGAQAFHNWLCAWILDHPEAQHLAPEVADTITYMVFGACNEYTYVQRLAGIEHPAPPEEFADRLASAAVAIIRSHALR